MSDNIPCTQENNTEDSIIKNEILPIVEDAKLSNEEKAKCIVRVYQESFSGPLPHPSMLEKYNALIPNGAERIMAMAEKQGEHRMKLEAFAIPNMQQQSGRGQLFAFILCLLLIIVGGFMAFKEQYLISMIVLTVTIVFIATLFIRGKNSVDRDIEEKK